ncbi:hypothetical protein Bca4012_019983 [Brassica carinata]
MVCGTIKSKYTKGAKDFRHNKKRKQYQFHRQHRLQKLFKASHKLLVMTKKTPTTSLPNQTIKQQKRLIPMAQQSNGARLTSHQLKRFSYSLLGIGLMGPVSYLHIIIL